MKNFILSLWFKFRHWQYERKCIKYFGGKPEIICLSVEDYDALVEGINSEPDPKVSEKFKEFMSRKDIWDSW